MHVPQSRCWNQRDCGLGSSLLPCGFWGWNFCNQACPQVPLTVELSRYPCFGADMQCSGDDLEFLITPTPSVLELQAWTTTPGFWSVYFVVPKWYLWCLFNCVCSCVDIMYVSEHRCPWRPETGSGSSKASFSDGFESPNTGLRPRCWAMFQTPICLFFIFGFSQQGFS